MGLGRLIGAGEDQLVPVDQPREEDVRGSARRKNTASAHAKRIRKGKVLTQHTGLPPRKNR
jgi:hypothetical protein